MKKFLVILVLFLIVTFVCNASDTISINPSRYIDGELVRPAIEIIENNNETWWRWNASPPRTDGVFVYYIYTFRKINGDTFLSMLKQGLAVRQRLRKRLVEIPQGLQT